ncbi:MAG: hypothetical protein JWM68_1834 [Verrucomicrobiales bacterium]|nr:hypothetical protein [Verrucomicrobiales bacterium]
MHRALPYQRRRSSIASPFGWKILQHMSDVAFEKFGKIVGLVVSVGFIIFSCWLLQSGRFIAPTSTELAGFYALFIILGGPIPYFFVSLATGLELKSWLGRFTVAGGYAVAVFAVVFVTNYVTAPELWRFIVVKGELSSSISIECDSPNGNIFPISEANPSSHTSYKALCNLRDKAGFKIAIFLRDDYGKYKQVAHTNVARLPEDLIIDLAKLP